MQKGVLRGDDLCRSLYPAQNTRHTNRPERRSDARRLDDSKLNCSAMIVIVLRIVYEHTLLVSVGVGEKLSQ